MGNKISIPLSVGTTPNAENNASILLMASDVVKDKLIKLEFSAIMEMVDRRFSIPEGLEISLVKNNAGNNIFDYHVCCTFDEDDVESELLVEKLDDEWFDYWDDKAKSKLTSQGYFEMMNRERNKDISKIRDNNMLMDNSPSDNVESQLDKMF